MAKSQGKGLIVLALLLGLIGAGLGGYVFFDSVIGPMIGLDAPYQEIHSYWVDDPGFDPVNTNEVYIDPMQITINTTQTSSLYVMFNCYVYLIAVDLVSVRIFINDVAVTGYMRHSAVSTSRTSIALQYSNSSVPAGTYTIQVRGQVLDPNTWYYSLSLYVQTVSNQ